MWVLGFANSIPKDGNMSLESKVSEQKKARGLYLEFLHLTEVDSNSQDSESWKKH